MRCICLADNVIPVVSETKSGQAKKDGPAEASLIMDLPTRQYEEVRILAEFHTPAGEHDSREKAINALGDRIFDLIRKDSNHRFYFMLNGAGTFSEMSRSLVAVYKTDDTGSSRSTKAAQGTLNPRVTSNVTPQTKEMLDTPEAAIASGLPPRARETKRVVERSENPKIGVGEIHLVDNVVFAEDMGINYLELAVENANNSKTALLDALPALYRAVQRMSGKCTSILSAKDDGSGEYFSARGRALAEYISMQDLAGSHYVPALLLFRKSNPGETVMDHIDKEKLQLGSIVEVLIYVLAPKGKSIADMESLKDVFVVCKTCLSGSFGGKSKMDIAVLFDVLSVKVLFLLTHFRNGLSYTIPLPESSGTFCFRKNLVLP